MDTGRYKERLFENENITGDLPDGEARWLLRWGAMRVDETIGLLEDPAAADAYVTALMALMRQVSRAASTAGAAGADRLAGSITAVEDLFEKVAPRPPLAQSPAGEDLERAAAALRSMPLQQAVEWLANRAYLAPAPEPPRWEDEYRSARDPWSGEDDPSWFEQEPPGI